MSFADDDNTQVGCAVIQRAQLLRRLPAGSVQGRAGWFSSAGPAAPSLSLMPQTNSELERLLAKRANGPLGRFGYLVDWRFRLRVSPKLLQVGLGPLAAFAAFLGNGGFLQVYTPWNERRSFITISSRSK